MFHKRGTIEVVVFNAVYKVLNSFCEVGIAVHLIAGNHDQVDASVIPTSSIHSFKDIAHIIENLSVSGFRMKTSVTLLKRLNLKRVMWR